MKRATVAALAAGGIGAALACGVITIPPEPMAPANTCTDDPSCGVLFPEAGTAPTCQGGACSAQTFPDGNPILVVAIPRDHGSLLGGVTTSLPTNYATLRISNLPGACKAPNGVECDPVPPLTTFSHGSLVVASGLDIAMWPPSGLRPLKDSLDTKPTSLPANVTFEMRFKDPATQSYFLARTLGILLDDVQGTEAQNFQLLGPSTTTSNQPGYELTAQVPQPLSHDDPMSEYTMNIVPTDPFTTFPPFVRTIGTPLSVTGIGPLEAPFQQIEYSQGDGGIVFEHQYEVDEDPGAPSLAGWTMHIDDAEGHRVSGAVVLGPGAKKTNISVFEATGTQSQNEEMLFIDPPPGVDLPRYTSPAIAGQIFGPFTYPALPPSVTLEGSVLTSDFQPAGAHLIFAANGATNYVLEADGTTPAPSLVYNKMIATTSSAQYSVTLPPGNLHVYVVPDDPSLALTELDKLVSPSSQPQKGATLTVRRRSHVKGRVLLPNGTPMFAAQVVVGASADSAFLPNDDPLARPRESRGTTDVNGNFDVLSDSGTVDISIRPHEGTSFPWVVIMNRKVPISDGADGGGPLTLTVGDVVVPVPSRYTQAPTGELVDFRGVPITHGVVRAYAFPKPVPTPDGGPPATRAARLIGLTTTDDSGYFQLFLAPPE